ncbi:MAG: DUF222 domain-containing protein, partial [Chloroflexi bacterium]
MASLQLPPDPERGFGSRRHRREAGGDAAERRRALQRRDRDPAPRDHGQDGASGGQGVRRKEAPAPGQEALAGQVLSRVPPLPALGPAARGRFRASRPGREPRPLHEHSRRRLLDPAGRSRPVGGAALRTALEPLAKPMGKFDYRERPQRLADALVELATAGGKVAVQMQVTSSIETLLGLLGAPGAETEFSLPVSSKTVERWACDSSITRVLMQDSVPIDVGRSKRTIRGPRRRALVARDKHCRWPGCERPASCCDGHHLVYWINGGSDELENMVLLWGLLPNSKGAATISTTSVLAHVTAGGSALDGVQSGRAEALPELLVGRGRS